MTTEQGWTPLHFAAFADNPSTALVLLESGACSEIADSEGRRPLELAREMGHTLVSDVLLNHGAAADPESRRRTEDFPHVIVGKASEMVRGAAPLACGRNRGRAGDQVTSATSRMTPGIGKSRRERSLLFATTPDFHSTRGRHGS